MPPSKNPKWFYLNYGESVRFKLFQVGSELDNNGKLFRFLAKPIFTHIRSYPFPNGRKTMACAGDRCEACLGGHKPTKMFPVHIFVTATNTEHIMDMTATAHESITEQIDAIIKRAGTDDDVLQTEFQLTRLQPKEKPYFICTTVQQDFDPTPEEMETAKITEADIEILRKINEQMKKQNPSNPRGSMIITLRKKFEWPDIKINNAFESGILDDYGYLTTQ